MAETRPQAQFILAELTPAQSDLIRRALAVACPLCEAPADVSCGKHATGDALENQFHYPRIVAARRKPVA